MSSSPRQVIDLSILTIIKFFFVLLVLFFLYFIKDILAVLFVSLIFSSAVDPWVDAMERVRFPRWLSILLIYIIFICAVFLIFYSVIPPLVQQFTSLADNFPEYFEKVGLAYESLREFSTSHGVLDKFDSGLQAIKNNLPSYFTNFFSTLFSFFGGLVSFLVVLVITFYMTVEESAVKRTITYILLDKYQPFTLQLINKVQRKIGDWLKGQLILCLIIGIMSYAGLLILGVDYALVLALFAAFGELIPYVGPTLSSIPAIFLAFTQSPLKALFVLVLYVLIQQIENHLLVPKVMQKAVGLNPIISIIALLIGAKLGGLVGVILSIPVATAVSVVLKEIWLAKEESAKAAERDGNDS